MGTIDQVWTKNGETLVRCIIGKRPDGSDWKTPWFKPNEFAGGHREERQWHKGQNVFVHCVDGNYRTATLSPYDTNEKHKRPANASAKVHSYQFGLALARQRASFTRREIRKGGNGGGSGAGSQSASSSGGGGFGRLSGRLRGDFSGGGGATGDFGSSDSPAGSAKSGHSSDSDKPVVFHNMGAPADQKDNNGPWDGPNPAESPHAQQSQEHQVGEEDEKPAKTTMTPEHIVHQVGDTSAVTISKDNVTTMVGGNGGMNPRNA